MALVLLALFGCGERDAAAPSPPAGVARPHPPFTVLGRCDAPLDLTVRLDPKGGPLPPVAFAEAVRAALDVWADTGCVAFREVAGDAAVVIGWSSAEEAAPDDFVEWVGSGARAGGVAGAGPTWIRFDPRLDWSRDGARGFGLFQTVLHELGHVLGLGHGADQDGVLYPSYDVHRTTLAPSDLAGLHSLYGGGSADDGDVRAGDTVVLRGVAPADRVGLAAVDTDGDGRDDLVTWLAGPGPLAKLTVWHFDAHRRLARTTGPFTAPVDPRRSVFGRESGGRSLVLQVYADRRYQAYMFGAAGLPSETWPPGRPLRLDRVRDEDGDGVLDGEGRIEPTDPVAADLDGDGTLEPLTRGR